MKIAYWVIGSFFLGLGLFGMASLLLDLDLHSSHWTQPTILTACGAVILYCSKWEK